MAQKRRNIFGNLITQAISPVRTTTSSNVVVSSTTVVRKPPPARPRPVVKPIEIKVPPTRINVYTRYRDQKYSDDILNVSSLELDTNNQFKIIEENGISSFRPEIISVVDFEPIYKPNSLELNEFGKLIDFEIQSSLLRQLTAKELVKSIIEQNGNSDSEIDKILESISKDFRTSIDRTKRTFNYIESYANSIENIKKKIDIKSIPDSSFSPKNFITLSEYFEKYLQYSKQKQEAFSNSKMYMQFVSDFKSILENYSFSLLNINDSDRIDDFNPIDIDNSYTTKDGFSFAINSYISETTPKNAIESQIFNSFLNSLPNNPDDRIKLLITVLSKEYRVSKNLSDKTVQQKLAQKFGSNPGTGADGTGNPFDNIIGIPGDTIFDPPVGDNSLSTLGYLKVNDSVTVLPFEKKYIDSESTSTTTSKKTFVPGTNYFIDSILKLDSNNKFNTKPFVDFEKELDDSIVDSVSIIEKLFDLKNINGSLSPAKMAERLFLSIKHSTSGVLAKDLADKNQAFSSAIFNLANTDNTLKQLLFQFLLLSGIYSHRTDDVKSIFRQLGGELQYVGNMGTYVTQGKSHSLSLTSNDLNSLGPYVNDLAMLIANRIFWLINPKGVKTSNDILTNINSNSQIKIDSIPDIVSNNINSKEVNAVFISKNEIKDFLVSITNSTVSTTPNFLKEFIDVANEFGSAATNGSVGYFLPDFSGRTRYNFISTSTQLLILFEIFSSLIGKYTFSSFIKTTNTLYAIVKTSIKSSIVVSDTIASIVNESKAVNVKLKVEVSKVNSLTNTTYFRSETKNISVDRTNLTNNDFKFNSLQTIHDKLANEDQIIIDGLNILLTFRKVFSNAKQIMLNAFNDTSLNSFLKENSINDLRIIKNITQTRTAIHVFQNYLDKITNLGIDNREFLINDPQDNFEINSMLSLMASPEFKQDKILNRTKIISIGIPVDFSNQLADRISKEKINKTSFQTKQFDVVSINVFMKDNRFDNIIFKPKKYLFDLSLYKLNSTYKQAKPNSTDNFSKIAEELQLEDLSIASQKQTVGITDIITNDQYSFLNEDDKRSLFYNHIKSQLLTQYIKYLCGFTVEEETFVSGDQITNSSNGINSKFESLVRKYISNTENENIPLNTSLIDSINNPNLSQETKDIIRLVMFGDTVVFDPENIRQKSINPKLFDRVFHIPVSINYYEIDEELTKSTVDGQAALEQDFIKPKLVRDTNGKLFMKLDEKDKIIFSDLFITIENKS